ncbi:MAG: RraA family protein [Alphaproteobacteria bacterium]|nr:RraA family protein [Alphaproteobacteria bacterium]
MQEYVIEIRIWKGIAGMEIDANFFAEGRRELSSGLLSDVLDGIGLPRHAMDPEIRPLDDSRVLFGRARTGQYVDRYHRAEGANPYEVEIALVDDLKPDDVVVMNCGATRRYAAWGELLTTAATARGAVGAVVDGQSRDVRQIREMGFPLFARGIGMLDAAGRGEMVARDVPIECGGVPVSSGDLVFADMDGALVIPAEAATEAVRLALEKSAGEDRVREALAKGELLSDVFERYGIL